MSVVQRSQKMAGQGGWLDPLRVRRARVFGMERGFCVQSEGRFAS